MFEAWCAALPGVTKVADGYWILPQQARISFPAGAHETLAAIEEASFWFNHRNRVIASVVRRFAPPGTLFDIGGGNGYVSLGLRAAGIDVAMIEPGAAGAKMALARGLPVLQAPFEELQAPENTIPAAGLFDVLEHIANDGAALTRLYALLQPGGRLYIAVPSHALLWSDEDAKAGHYRRYNAAQLCDRLRQAGFSIEYWTYFFAVLLLPILLLRAIPARLGITRRKIPAQDHSLPHTWMGGLVAAALRHEARKIDAGRCIRMGASLLVVARKLG